MDTEKITINATVVDLGKVDVLVSQGLFANRADFIRTAMRRLIDENEPIVRETVTRNHYTVGIVVWGAKVLEGYRDRGERLRSKNVGMLKIREDVSPDLADEVIEEVTIRGVLRAPPAVLERLKPKIDRVRG